MGLKYRVVRYYDSFEDIANDTGSGGGGSSEVLTAVSYSQSLQETDPAPESQDFDLWEYIYSEGEDKLYTCIYYGPIPNVYRYGDLIRLTQLDLSGFPELFPDSLSNYLVLCSNEAEDAAQACFAIFKVGSKISENEYSASLMASKDTNDGEAESQWTYNDNDTLYRIASFRDIESGVTNDNKIIAFYGGVTPHYVGPFNSGE